MSSSTVFHLEEQSLFVVERGQQQLDDHFRVWKNRAIKGHVLEFINYRALVSRTYSYLYLLRQGSVCPILLRYQAATPMLMSIFAEE